MVVLLALALGTLGWDHLAPRAPDAANASLERLALPLPGAPSTAMPDAPGPGIGAVTPALPGPANPPTGGGDEAAQTSEIVTIAEGDTLAGIFDRMGLARRDLDAILKLGEPTGALARLAVGQRLIIDARDGELHRLECERGLHEALIVERADGGFRARLEARSPAVEVIASHGAIEQSLFLSGQEAGLSDAMVMKLASVFGYDIDFVLDIRRGDRFSVIFQQYLRDGRAIADGDILAAEFVNDGVVYRAVRFVDDEGHTDYYTVDGKSLRKSFLRTPVNFSRISSHFNLRRRHPVLNTIRAHRGVDYAAPVGTPVHATGDGKVAFVGNRGGYGKAIVIQHGERYSTLYAHLSRFARTMTAGKAVRQGQTIGYVGRTGLATGPHLHYEFQVDGVHRNPLTVELPRALPVPREQMETFRSQTRAWLAQLDDLSRENVIATSAEPTDASLAAKLPANAAPR